MNTAMPPLWHACLANHSQLDGGGHGVLFIIRSRPDLGNGQFNFNIYFDIFAAG
jgi:hypothetical protein